MVNKATRAAVIHSLSDTQCVVRIGVRMQDGVAGRMLSRL